MLDKRVDVDHFPVSSVRDEESSGCGTEFVEFVCGGGIDLKTFTDWISDVVGGNSGRSVRGS
jgi:hypothetical protein